MSDPISRQAAVGALKDMYHAAEKWGAEASDDVIKARAESCMASLVEMKLRIEKLPSAQPERRTATWIEDSDPGEEIGMYWACSNCKHGIGGVTHSEMIAMYHFCPNCGADMRTAAQIVHDAIDNTPMAEDAYPGIKERLHKAVDDMREGTT